MSVALTSRWSVKGVLPWLGTALLAVLLAVNLWHDTLFHRTLGAAVAPAPEAAAKSPTSVTLPEGKFKAAHLATAPAELVALPMQIDVTGRIEANTDRRVEMRPRAPGVIRQVHVALGQKVKAGDVLATLDSAEIGAARLTLRARQRTLAAARFEADWRVRVAANVEKLVPELRKGVDAEVIDKQYADRPLGSYRATLLQAYSAYDIAAHEEIKTFGLHKDLIVGEHPAALAKHTRESAQAKFEGELEQVRFDAGQQAKLAKNQLQLAEGEVIDAAQRLRILGVAEDVAALLADAGAVAASAPDEDLTAYRVVAPFDGTIIEKTVVPSQKAEPNDKLFILADLSTVWVMANIPESDFAKLSTVRDETIHLTAAAYPGQTFDAKLLSVGALVDETTRTVLLLAETPNPDGVLKLGMFVRIVLDTATAENVLTVPDSAVVEVDGHKGVFVPSGDDGRTFTFHRVKLGRESGNRQVVLSGLSRGDSVVATGAFLLKSELILQNEPEED